MLDLDTFLTTLYVLVDDTVKLRRPSSTPGPGPDLSTSEVITLALVAQWKRFASERAFARFADKQLRPAFPGLPDRSQLNRLIRSAHDALVAFCQDLVVRLGRAHHAYELLDGMGVAVRNNRRTGRGWLDGIAATGWSNRLGWYDGFHVLTAVGSARRADRLCDCAGQYQRPALCRGLSRGAGAAAAPPDHGWAPSAWAVSGGHRV